MNSRNLLTAGILTLGLNSGAHAVLIDDFDGASGTVGAECTFGPTDETNGAPIGGRAPCPAPMKQDLSPSEQSTLQRLPLMKFYHTQPCRARKPTLR